ncbi:MAG: hypothetical protein ACYCW5_01370 [Thermoleophilia bacterium]
MRVGKKLAIGSGLGFGFALLGFLPLILMTLPNPRPVTIPGLAGERIGTYVNVSDSIYKLFPYATSLQEFPADALTAEPSSHIFLKYRQLDDLDSYNLYKWKGGDALPVAKDTNQEKTLELIPESRLEAGEYFVQAARDGMYGGTDYFYFRVSGGD